MSTYKISKGIAASLLCFLLVAFFTQMVWAAEPASKNEPLTQSLNIFTLLWKGGWLMIPIALASVVALTIAVERFLSLRKNKMYSVHFLPGLKNSFEKNVEEAEAYCQREPGILSRILLPGLRKIPKGEEYAIKAMEEAGGREADKMKRALKPLSMIANVAPLLGLLGTVYGMIGAFQAAATTTAGNKSDVLAKGIYEALVTTAAGLTLAIPVLIAYQFLNNRVDRLLECLDDGTEEFLDFAFPAPPVNRQTKETVEENQNPKEPEHAY